LKFGAKVAGEASSVIAVWQEKMEKERKRGFECVAR